MLHRKHMWFWFILFCILNKANAQYSMFKMYLLHSQSASNNFQNSFKSFDIMYTKYNSVLVVVACWQPVCSLYEILYIQTQTQNPYTMYYVCIICNMFLSMQRWFSEKVFLHRTEHRAYIAMRITLKLCNMYGCVVEKTSKRK